jgi:uncharacterized protein YjlB
MDERIGATEFFTQDDSILQVGQIALSSKKRILAHRHNPIPRSTVGTNEVLVILKGTIKMHLYGDGSEIEITKEVNEGQAVLLVGGGHAFESDVECKVLEIKNGPFLKDSDKEYLT